MKNRFIKFLTLILLSLIPFVGLTNASFSDDEISTSYFSAGSLNLELQKENGIEHEGLFFDKDKLQSEFAIEKKINVLNEGSVDFYYYPVFKFNSGKSEVCEELGLTAVKDGSEVFKDNLSDFDLASGSAQVSGAEDEWEFEIEHDSEDVELQGENCDFDIEFKAYQDKNSEDGFTDTEKLSNKIGIAYEPELSASHNGVSHEFIFTLTNLSNFAEFEYDLTYDTDTISDFVAGSEVLSGGDSKTVEIILGSCSSENSCTYHVEPNNFDLNINLTDIDGDNISISEQL